MPPASQMEALPLHLQVLLHFSPILCRHHVLRRNPSRQQSNRNKGTNFSPDKSADIITYRDADAITDQGADSQSQVPRLPRPERPPANRLLYRQKLQQAYQRLHQRESQPHLQHRLPHQPHCRLLARQNNRRYLRSRQSLTPPASQMKSLNPSPTGASTLQPYAVRQ